MADKTLATFRIEPEKWERFKALASSNGTSASAILIQVIDNCIDRNSIPPTPGVNNSLDNIEALIDNHIETHIDKIQADLATLRSHFEAQLEELRGKSKAR